VNQTTKQTMKMGKKELGKWNHFGDIQAMGKSVPQGWFGTILLSKWMHAGLVRTVRFWEDSVEISGGMVREWNTGESIATEKGLEIL
jgi:hypothetical protein